MKLSDIDIDPTAIAGMHALLARLNGRTAPARTIGGRLDVYGQGIELAQRRAGDRAPASGIPADVIEQLEAHHAHHGVRDVTLGNGQRYTRDSFGTWTRAANTPAPLARTTAPTPPPKPVAKAPPTPKRTPESAEQTLARLSPTLRAEAEAVLRREAPESFAECSHEFTMGECRTWGCSHHHMSAERRAHAAELRRGWTPKPSTPPPSQVPEHEPTLADLALGPTPEPDADVLAILSAGCRPAPTEPEQRATTHEHDELTTIALDDIDATTEPETPTEPDASPVADLADMASDGDVIPPTPIDDTDSIPDDAA